MTGDAKPLRADALRNRARVLEAAELILARDGLSASMRAIAQEAGVGLGTIYRHFPTREALHQAIIADRMRRLIDEGEELRTAADPGAAFLRFFTLVVDSAKRKKILADALAQAGVDPKDGLSDVRRDMRHAIESLLTRAQRSGAIREDLRMPELLALLSATCVAAERSDWSPDLQDRTLRLLFDAFLPGPRRHLPPCTDTP
ncbi:TetR/AcrR family transcriptional regulator [Planobispora takensis]|uniref:TetR family transcriptional regulator n=1 Tax=Planobispora takensis TaxID=1367882 RepID=A0A8J3WQF0_9ACTN|nr:TetR/AcrR family transcriptional regulator [Planobispora takensis]GIH98854.1 TetR family transcriptional regulator [Planobispora takensis]